MRVITTRGDCAETVHPFSAVICGVLPNMTQRIGPSLMSTWRSSAKPFQLLASLEWLGSDYSAPLLAIGTASHSAEPRHIRTVRAVLDVLDISEHSLRCGAHPPIHSSSYHHLIRSGTDLSPLHNNCSGKHAFMVGALAANGYSGQDYRAVTHPFQQHVKSVIQRFTGPMRYSPGTDGCGVPCWILSLEQMARAWQQFAVAIHEGTGALSTIGVAMQQHPELMSGTDRLDLAVSQASSGQVISKVGAAGLLCIAIPHLQTGIALKVHSGHSVARAAACRHILSTVVNDCFDRDHAWFSENAIVRNVVGDIVGQVYCE